MTTEELKVNSLISNKTDEMKVEPQIKVSDGIFDFNNDAQLTFEKDDETKIVKISEMLTAKKCVNGIITLEKTTWFMDSSMVDNNIFNQDENI